MKKIIIISLAGVLIGTCFAFYVFSNINENAVNVLKESKFVTAFQIGVFNVYDNAKKLADKQDSSYIYKDEDKYRVFLAIYQDKEIINYMTNYYSANNIDFYLKELNVNESFLNQLNKYEKLLKKTDNNENYIIANKNILKSFGDSL